VAPCKLAFRAVSRVPAVRVSLNRISERRRMHTKLLTSEVSSISCTLIFVLGPRWMDLLRQSRINDSSISKTFTRIVSCQRCQMSGEAAFRELPFTGHNWPKRCTPITHPTLGDPTKDESIPKVMRSVKLSSSPLEWWCVPCRILRQ